MKAIGIALIALVSAAGAYGWYFLYGPVEGIKTRGTPSAAVVAAAEPQKPGEEPPAAPAKTIRVDPSKEQVEAFPATVTVWDGEKKYVAEYTGQFRRNKKIIINLDTYDIASYVVQPEKGETSKLLDDMLVDGKAKVYMLRFVSALPGRQIMNDIYNEINSSFTDVDLDRLKQGVDDFCGQFRRGSKKGEVVYIVWLPDGKVYSAFNTPDPLEFIAQDVPFARALWRIWAGPRRGDIRFNLVRRYADPPLLK